MQHTTKSEKDTQELGVRYAADLKGGEVFLLTGELGGGKTQFAKGLAEGMGISDAITSPTFNYENIYTTPGLTLYHFDLYREERLDSDIEALLREAMADKKGVTLIEWAERAEHLWPKGAYVLDFTWSGDTERKIDVTRK